MELSPCRTLVTSFSPRTSTPCQDRDDFEEGVWVLCVTAHSSSPSSSNWVSCALSNGEIIAYDQERLHQLHSIPKAHGDAMITDLTTGGPNVVASSGKDGRVCLFDVRQAGTALQCQLPRKEEALSVSIGFDGAVAAVGGSKAKIHFYDLRQVGGNSAHLLGSYVDAHTEDVTRVRFQPNPLNEATTSPMLVTASEDGLMCVFDTGQPTEEAALKSVMNAQTPLREVGFFGPSYEGLYCQTGSETMSVWHHDSALRICDFGMDFRSKLSQAAGGMNMDYLVNCHWDSRLKQLSLLAGNSSGDAALYKVDAGAISLSHVLRSGHKGCVRSWCPLSSSVFVTGGEDARLCEWNRMGNLSPLPRGSSSSSKCVSSGVLNGSSTNTSTNFPPLNGGGPLRRPKKKVTEAPY